MWINTTQKLMFQQQGKGEICFVHKRWMFLVGTALSQSRFISSQKVGECMSRGDPAGYMGVISVTRLGGPWMGWWRTWICCFDTDTQGQSTTPPDIASTPKAKGSGEGVLSSHLSLRTSHSPFSNQIETGLSGLYKKSELGEHFQRLNSLVANSAFGVQRFN